MKFSTKARVSLRHLTSRPLHTFSVVSVIAVSSALAVALFLLVQGLRGGLTRAVEPFDLIIGAKGSPYQLVLNTVFLRDVPIGNVEWSDFAAVSDDPRVSLAIPLAFGDGYEGFPVVGTTPDILGIAGPAGPWLSVGEGRWFEGGFEAVFGAQAAAGSGARVGESFKTSHGVVAGDRHDALFKCVGIAERTNGPYDRAIFVSLRSVWANHRHKDDEESEPDAGEITAVLARPVSYSAAYSLAVSYQKDKACQLVFPAQTVIRLFSIMGRGERFLSLIVHAVSGCAFLTTILILYWSTKERAPERALLRILGVPRSSLVLISWMEGLFTIAAGAIAGEILGRLGVYAAFRFLGDATAVDSSMPFSIHEAAAPVILLVTASLASLAVALGENKTGGELPPRR